MHAYDHSVATGVYSWTKRNFNSWVFNTLRSLGNACIVRVEIWAQIQWISMLLCTYALFTYFCNLKSLWWWNRACVRLVIVYKLCVMDCMAWTCWISARFMVKWVHLWLSVNCVNWCVYMMISCIPLPCNLVILALSMSWLMISKEGRP